MAEAQYQEVLTFLHDRNPSARNVALSNILPLTEAGNPLRSLFFRGANASGLKAYTEPEVIRDLKLLCRDQPATAHDAFKALVNLSDTALIAPSMTDPLFLSFLVSYILHPASLLSDLACMLLSNITAQPTTCSNLLKLEVDIIPIQGATNKYYPIQSRCATSPSPTPYPDGKSRKSRALSLLVDVFAGSAGLEGQISERKGQLHFLASVFANISKQPEGRKFFLSPHVDAVGNVNPKGEVTLANLLPFTEHPDVIRRGGVASTIKNCCFMVEAHTALLSPEKEMCSIPTTESRVPGLYILPRVLLPLAGPEEFELDDVELLLPELQFLPSSKVREKDAVIRLMHVETLLLLCTTRFGRDVQRNSGVYEIIRAMHETENDENVITHIDRLVNMLKRDEPPEDDTSKPVSSTGGDDDSDDERIVEI